MRAALTTFILFITFIAVSSKATNHLRAIIPHRLAIEVETPPQATFAPDIASIGSRSDSSAPVVDVPLPAGHFAFQFSHPDGTLQSNIIELKATGTLGEMTLRNLLGTDSEIPVKACATFFRLADREPIALPTLSIAGNGATKLTATDSDGSSHTFDIYLAAMSSSLVVHTDDIKLIIDPTARRIFSPYGEGVGIALLSNSLGNFYLDNPRFFLTNGTMNASLYSVSRPNTFEQHQEPVYGCESNNTLTVLGALASSNALEFTLNKQARTAIATDQVHTSSTDGPYLYSGINNNYSVEYGLLHAHVSDTQHGLSVSFSDPAWCAWNEHTQTYNIYGTDTSMTFDFDYSATEPWTSLKMEASVGAIVPDEAMHGQPVYYDLNGIPTESPLPGHIYIVRQGNETSKTLIP